MTESAAAALCVALLLLAFLLSRLEQPRRPASRPASRRRGGSIRTWPPSGKGPSGQGRSLGGRGREGDSGGLALTGVTDVTTRESPAGGRSTSEPVGATEHAAAASAEGAATRPAAGLNGPPASPFPAPAGNGPVGGPGSAPTTPTGPAPRGARGTGGEPSVGQLVTHASAQLGDLIRMELQLAAAEMKQKGRHAGTGAGLFGGAAVVALYGAGAVVFAAIAALALVLPLWAAALLIGVLLFIVAAAMAAIGKQEVGRAVPPVPGETLESAKQDVNEITERAHR